MIKQVLLDMDGVITDFVAGVCELHGRPDPYVDESNHGEFSMDKIWGMTSSEFWDRCGYDFWFNLQPSQECGQILHTLDTLIGLKNVCLLTAPCQTKGCVDGKRDWVSKHLPDFSKRLLVGSAKEFLAAPNKLLIDDRNENVESFVYHGGRAFLFPRPWNDGRFSVVGWQKTLPSLPLWPN